MRTALSLLAALISVSIAGSAAQTDWSGGPGVWGPVTEWGSQFCLDTDVVWRSMPGEVVLRLVAGHVIDGGFSHANSVCSQDIDGDGDMDALGAAVYGDEIAWWENVDGSGTSWIKHTISGSFDGASSVYSEDIDGDGDMDVLGTASAAWQVAWWRNADGTGTSWEEHILDYTFGNANDVYAEDIDGDGDRDILASAGSYDQIAWYENLDGSGSSWVKHIVASGFNGARSTYSQDIDGDGYMDVLGAAEHAEDIVWWRNNDGSGTSWTKHVVDSEYDQAISVHADDVDGDGDMDILGASFGADDITWWENSDTSPGVFWTEHTVDGSYDRASCVYSADIDGDGHVDILGSSIRDFDITWWENSDTSPGAYWIEHTVADFFIDARSVYAADIDGDGQLDILGAAQAIDKIAWWNVWAYTEGGALESSLLDTGAEPDWGVIEWNSVVPLGALLGLQVRSSDSPGVSGMGSWSDTLWAGCSLEGILTDGDRYAQYRAILGTVDPDVTPVLQDVTMTWDPLGCGEPASPATELLGVTPNPCGGPVAVGFVLSGQAGVQLSIFDLAGRVVLETSGCYPGGRSEVAIPELLPGVYFVRMTAGDFSAAQRFVVTE